eukprot:c40011_g1_i1 orf=108-266(+)
MNFTSAVLQASDDLIHSYDIAFRAETIPLSSLPGLQLSKMLSTYYKAHLLYK